MHGIKIKKGDKYYHIYHREFYNPLREVGLWIETDGGEGMEVGSHESELYDAIFEAINKFYEEKF